MADKYITREELRIDPYNINHEKVDDKFLETLQDMTFELINDVLCQQSFEQEGSEGSEVEKAVDGTGKDTIFLPKRLVSLLKVRLYEATNTYYDYSADNFVVKPKYLQWNTLGGSLDDPRVIRDYYTFPKGIANIGVFGIWGYASVPNDIKYLQGKLIQKIVEDKSFAQKFQQESIGDYSYSLRRNLQQKEEEITGDFELDRIIKYRRGWVKYGSV